MIGKGSLRPTCRRGRVIVSLHSLFICLAFLLLSTHAKHNDYGVKLIGPGVLWYPSDPVPLPHNSKSSSPTGCLRDTPWVAIQQKGNSGDDDDDDKRSRFVRDDSDSHSTKRKVTVVQACQCNGTNTTGLSVNFLGSTFKLIASTNNDDQLFFSVDGHAISPDVDKVDKGQSRKFTITNLSSNNHTVRVDISCLHPGKTVIRRALINNFNVRQPQNQDQGQGEGGTSEPQGGVIAGAVVAAAVGSFLLTILGWLLFRRYRRRNNFSIFSDPPENRIDPLDISKFGSYSKSTARRIRSGNRRPGTSTFHRLYSFRFKDGLPHFRAPPSINPPSTDECHAPPVSVVIPSPLPKAKNITRNRSGGSGRMSMPPPRRATHPPGIREAYEVTPFKFDNQDGVLSDDFSNEMSSVGTPLHVQTQMDLHARRRGSYPSERTSIGQPTDVPMDPATMIAEMRKARLNDDPIALLPTAIQANQPIGQRRAFYVANQTSASSLRSSGVPPVMPSPDSAQTPQIQAHAEAPLENQVFRDTDAEYVNSSSRRAWQKSARLPRIDDGDEDLVESPREAPELPIMRPTTGATGAVPVSSSTPAVAAAGASARKKKGMRVFFTTNPSSISSSSISSRSLSQAKEYIKRKRRRQRDEEVLAPTAGSLVSKHMNGGIIQPSKPPLDVPPSEPAPAPTMESGNKYAHAQVHVRGQTTRSHVADHHPPSTHLATIVERHAPVPTPGVMYVDPVRLHKVTPRSPTNTPIDLNASTGGVPSSVSAGLSDERAADFDIESSVGHLHRPQMVQSRNLGLTLAGATAANANVNSIGTKIAFRGVRPLPQPIRKLPKPLAGNKRVFYATNPSTISEPSVLSSAEVDVEVSAEGLEEEPSHGHGHGHEQPEDLVSPVSNASSIPRPRLDKGKARAFY